MGLRLRVLGTVLVFVGGVACSKPITPPQPRPAENPADPVYAYSTTANLRVMRGPTQVAEVPAKQVSDAEWAADGSRFVGATSTELISVDAKTGIITKAGCECGTVAVAAGKVFAGSYGDKEVKVYDLATLKPAETIPLDLKLGGLDGAGDRVVLFLITFEGARDETDVVVFNPATKSRTKVGSAIGARDAAFTPRGWRGGPMFAYATLGSTGAQTAVASVVWFDPTSTEAQVETDDKPLRAKTPNIADADWNSGSDHVWWAADGTLRVTAWTWSCTDAGPLQGKTNCVDGVPPTQWKFDGNSWNQIDRRVLETAREIGGGATVEQGVLQKNSAKGRPLTLVDKDNRTILGDDVRRVWTPPQLRSATPPPPKSGSQELAERFAPLVWLHPDEPDFPTSTTNFVHNSVLWFDHGGRCFDEEPVATNLDEAKLGAGEYQHQAAIVVGERNVCAHTGEGKTYKTNQEVDSQEGNGFYLDVNENALHGNKPGSDGKVTAPVYWEYVDGEDGHHGAYLYWFFYGNDTYPPGSHEGDWERIAVQLTDGRQTGVAFWKHEAPVCRLDWGNVESSANHPVIFAAKGGHGSYARQSKYPVYNNTQWGTDETGKGYEWITAHEVLSVKDQPWYGYLGHWGKRASFDLTSGKPGPNDKRDLSNALTANKCDPGLPLGFAGTWKSDQPVTDPGHPNEYRIHVTLTQTQIGEQTATAFYPGLGCDGLWVLAEATPDKAVFQEARRPDPDNRCLGTARVELTRTPTGLHYARTDDHQKITATAELSTG